MNTDPTGMCLGAYCNLKCLKNYTPGVNIPSNLAARPNSKANVKEEVEETGYYKADVGNGGNVYIAPQGNKNETIAKIQASSGYNAKKDVIVLYSLTTEKGPNFQVLNSYKIIDDSQIDAICARILTYDAATNTGPVIYGRTLFSMSSEWKWHNALNNVALLLGMEEEHQKAQHVDLDAKTEETYVKYLPFLY